MKNIILSISILFTLSVKSQNVKNRCQDSDISIKEKVIIEKDTFDLYLSKDGFKYIKYLTKLNKCYTIWVGTKTNHMYDGQNVYKTRKGKYYIYRLSDRNKIPYSVYVSMK